MTCKFSIEAKIEVKESNIHSSKRNRRSPMPSFHVIRPLLAPFAVVSAVALLSHYPELVSAQGQLHTPPKSTNVFTNVKGGVDFRRSSTINAARVREMRELLAVESKMEGVPGTSATMATNAAKANKQAVGVIPAIGQVRYANTVAAATHSLLNEINEATTIVDRKSVKDFQE